MLNPVLRRELRTVLRSWKVYAGITLYVLVLAIVAGISLYAMGNQYYYSPSYYNAGFDPQNTTTLYSLLSAFQFGLMLLITPALTAGAISGERERQTLNLMLITQMSTFKIVVGKLMSSLMVTVLMIVASMPVFAIVFYYGGISITNLISMVLYTLLSGAAIGSISIFFSTLFKRTVSTTVMSYILIMVMCIGTLVVCFVFYWLFSSFLYNENHDDFYQAYQNLCNSLNFDVSLIFYIFILAFNPFAGFFALLDTQIGTGIMDDFLYYQLSFNYYGSRYTDANMNIWIYNIIVNILIMLIMLLLTSRILKPVKESRKNK